ncbi:hypothetical protein AeMF1_008349 [Aphanomyces euteiches]|nr:hypothetical protein AeMF1_011136 [Aphanomyces euteiches]KAH9118566.1 hypothetical protein AeMF1_008349 [Aphanomyces euteiches]KAH9166676.1 hypothetical protein AeNC1_018297 [Aphanomyces euteiches]
MTDLLNVVHVDEKWFFMTKLRRNYLLWHDEECVPRHLYSKGNITKVMFLVAVARPRDDWDGKLGCWPFTEVKGEQRSSKNRPAGTPIVQTGTVTRDVYRRFLLDKVYPAIKSKWVWPDDRNGGVILVQQDNARPHVAPDDPEVLAAGQESGWSIRMMNQPAQSPDLNVLDLGFFNSIQALQQQMECRTIEELVKAVSDAFEDLPADKLDQTFKTLQRVMDVVIEVQAITATKFPEARSPKTKCWRLS